MEAVTQLQEQQGRYIGYVLCVREHGCLRAQQAVDTTSARNHSTAHAHELGAHAAFEAVVRDYPWRRYSRICDIGGAYGSLLSRLLQQCGKADGVLFDQPQARKHFAFNAR